MPSIGRLFNFVAGTPAVADEVDAELNQLVATINALDAANIVDGSLTNAEIAAAANIALSKLAIRPMVRVTNSGGTSVGDGATVVLSWDTERYDTASLHGANPSRLTAPLAGIYAVWANVELNAGSNAMSAGVELRANGGTVIAGQRGRMVGDAGSIRLVVYTEYELAAGGYVECRVTQTSGAPVSVIQASSYSPEFGMSFLGRTS